MEPAASILSPVLREDFYSLAKRLDFPPLQGSTWLITGATGFIPSYLVSFLHWLDQQKQLDLTLHLWVRSMPKAELKFPWAQKHGRVRVTCPDWNHPDQWQVPACDFAIHAASPATPAACAADPEAVKACNITGSRRLLDRMNPSRLRGFLFFSSSEVYGDTKGDAFPDENQLGVIDPASIRANYPLAKRAGEEACRNAARAAGLPTRSARIFHTYGPGMDLEGDGRVFADFVRNIVRGEDIIIRGDGRGRRAFCYIEDTVSALLTILFRGDNGGCYNVGNPNAVLSMGQLGDLLVGLAPTSGLKKVLLQEMTPQSVSGAVFPNVDRMRKLGWSARTGPVDGFRRTIQSYLQ